MKKRVIKILFAVAVAVSLLVAVNLVANAATSGIYTYTISNGEATITDCDPDVTGNIVIPSTLRGYPVTSIRSHAFDACDSLTRVTIPNSIISIGEYAFYACDSLTSVTIGDGVTTIGFRVFSSCDSLTSVNIPDSVINIGGYAFEDCTSLTSIVIPDSVTSVGERVFDSCTSLTSVTIPTSVTSIGKWAFYGCDSLTSVYITDIAAWCRISFYDNYSNPLNYAKNLYLNGELVTDLVIPDSVTSIGNYAFYDYRSLTSIDIPDCVTRIGRYAFSWCTSLTSVYITDIAAWCRISFYDNYSNPLNYAKNLYLNGELVTDLVIPNGVTSIGNWAFEYCDSLTSITIPNSVTSIGNWAFSKCPSLRHVEIPVSVTSIGSQAFENCTSLTKIEVGEGNANYVSVDGVLFNKDKTNLICFPGGHVKTSYTIPYSVTSIDYRAFCYCTSLTNIEIPDGVTSIGDYAFYNCASLKNVYFAGTQEQWNVITIGDYNTPLTNATVHYLGEPADYSTIESALAMVEALDRALYTENSLKELDDAVNTVDYTLSVKDQDKVDAYVTTIVNAVSELKLKADYSTIESALAMVEALDRALYTENSLKELDDAVNTVDYTLSIDEQDVVDACATSIVDAIARLAFKPADYTAVEEALAKVPADLTIYTAETAQAVTDAVNAVVYGLTADKQETVDGYAQAIEDAVANLKIFGTIEVTDNLVNYRLRCTTAVVDGNLVLTATTAGTSSMKVRLGNLPEGATVAMVGTNANASMSSGIITVTNPGMKNVNVPMTITSAEGIVTEFVLVADFNNAIRYATYARLSQTGNNITVTSGAATAYVLFDTTEIDGGYVEVENVSRNLLGRYVISGSAVRFYNPVYDEGTVTVNVKNANGETVETYNVTTIFADATDYTPVLESSLRCTYTVDGDNITVTANAGVSNVYLNFGRYYSESLSASVNNDIIKKMGARSWRIMACDEPVEFDLYFDATAYDAEKVTRHVTVSF